MKNKGKSRMKKLIAAAMLVCMLTCSLDTGFVMPVLADDGTPTEQSVDLDTSDVDVLDVGPGVSDTTDTTVGDPVTDDTATNGVPTEQGETEENAPAEGGEEQTEQPEQQQDVEQPEATQPETEQPETEQPEATSVSLQAEADGVKFTALNVDESFPYVSDFSNFSLTVVRSAISDVRLEDAIAETNDGDVVNLSTYDLHFFNGSNEVVPNSNVSVMVENAGILPEEGQWIQTYFYNKADGTAKKCPTQWNKSSGAVTVTVKDNGEYALTVLKVKDGIKLTAVANDVEITLTAPADAFPQEGELTLAAEEITDERLEQAKETINEKMFTGNQEIKSYRLFDVTPMLDGEEIQPKVPVRVSFKNLVLTDEEGITTDVREKLEEEGKVVTEDDKIPVETLKLEETDENEPVDTEEKVKVFHFEDENTPEEINVAADTQEVVTELDHFSWVLTATAALSGDEYVVGDSRQYQSYEAESGIGDQAYTLDYILRHYNVFCSGDYLGTHVVGPMVVGGQTMLHGSLGGTTQGTGDYIHTVPSYLEGYAYNEDNTDSFPEIITARKDMPIYIGQANNQDPEKHKVNYNPHFWTPSYAGNGDTPTNPAYMYVDFKKAFPTNVSDMDKNDGTSNFPQFNRDTTTPKVEDRPWNKDDAPGYVSKGTPDKVPNGAIYGTETDPAKGTINYYRNFDGYDVNGRRVLPVNIPANLFTKILDETNDGKGPNSNNEEMTGTEENKREDRRIGVTRYYKVKDGDPTPIPVDTLNNMNGGRGATPADFDDPSKNLNKSDYCFAIDTKNTQFKLDENGAAVPTALPTIDVSVRLRPGFNFTFDKFETGKSNKVTSSNIEGTSQMTYNGKIQNIVYDYKTSDEMSNNLMIISTNEHTEQVVIPRIYKSVANDVFGHDYMFDSIEKGPGFSALWFAPYVREVYVGFTDPWARVDATNGSKMVGHLCVPQADVWLGGGDFNGGIIARNVDASTVGSEGHMWPFVIGSAINGVRIDGEKRVDGASTGKDEQFFFKYDLEQKTDSSYKSIKKDVIGHIPGGKFRLELEGGTDLPAAGEYRITFSELMSDEEFKSYASLETKEHPEKIGYDVTNFNSLINSGKYTFDPKVFRGTFNVKQQETAPTQRDEKAPKFIVDPSSTKIAWKVDADGTTNGAEDFVEFNHEILIFNNTSSNPLKVVKEWQDTDGKPLTSPPKEEITYDLYRDSTAPSGNKVSINIYSTDNVSNGARKQLVKSDLVGYVDDGKDVSFNIELDKDEELTVLNWGTYASAGVYSVTLSDTLPADDPKKATVTFDGSKYMSSLDGTDRSNTNPVTPRGADVTIKNVNEDIVINVLYLTPEFTVVRSANPPYEYQYSGGYSGEGMVEATFHHWQDGDIKVQVPKRTLIPEKDVFSYSYFDVDADAWNAPPFIKYDDKGNVVRDEEGNPVHVDPILTAEKITNADWTKLYNELPPRDENGNPYYYKVVEHPSVDGYTTSYSGNIIRITNSTSEKPTTIKIINKAQKGASLTIDKVDESDKLITNGEAKFQVYKKTTKVVDNANKEVEELMRFVDNGTSYEYTTSRHTMGATDVLVTKGGKWNISFLPYGKYVIKEIEAPNGYELETGAMHIEITESNLHWELKAEDGTIKAKGDIKYDSSKDQDGNSNVNLFYGKFTNKAQGGPELPNSGGPGFRMFTIGGISFIAISLMIIYYEIARRRKEDLVQVKQTYHKDKM